MKVISDLRYKEIMKTQDIKRKDAAKFIEEVLKLTMQLEDHDIGYHGKLSAKEQTAQLAMMSDIGNRLRTIASTYGLEVPRKCIGEAHGANPYADHCSVCMPNWGLMTKEVKVK